MNDTNNKPNDSSDAEIKNQRKEKQDELIQAGFPPSAAPAITGTLEEIIHDFAEQKEVNAAGRLTASRRMGKSIFADLNDGSSRLQLFAGKSQLGEDAFNAFKLLDCGDIIWVKGELFLTRTGEKTIRIKEWKLLTKSLLPLPEKWHGLRDINIRYRKRYIDLIANPEVRDLFNKRLSVISEIRSFLNQKQFLEVETPIMQPQPGGAIAKPFKTHYDSLGTNMFLRIAPELYLKRLLIGGFNQIFELNRNFRNEGISRMHNPEFTMLEIYKTYSNMEGMKDLIQELICNVSEKVFGSLKVGSKDKEIDLSLPWREISFTDILCERMGKDWFNTDIKEAKEKANELGLNTEEDWDLNKISHEIFEKVIEKELINPTFVLYLPSSLIPLAKRCEDSTQYANVFELAIGGMEIAPGYTEENDAVLQRQRLEQQAEEQGENVDEDFLTSLEHGMPPAGGMGIGIDRLVMVLTGAQSIRDVILFPQLRLQDN
jgi:lysyl-tRNA synthetase, class II